MFKSPLFALLLLSCSASFCFADIYNGEGGGGFGGTVSSSTLELEYDVSSGIVNGTFNRGAGDFNDELVLYIDSVSGGFSDTSGFEDDADTLRRAISGFDNAASSQVNFASGFEADFALAISPAKANFGGLWGLAAGSDNSLIFVSSLGLTPTGSATDSVYQFSFALSDIGLATGSSFDFVGTYLNGDGVFRSDESFGTTDAAGNPGFDTINFQNSLSFTAVPEPSALSLLGVGTLVGFARRRRR